MHVGTIVPQSVENLLYVILLDALLNKIVDV